MSGLVAFQVRTILRGRWALVAILGFSAATAVVTVLGLGSFRQLGLGTVGPAALALLNLALLLPTAQGMLLGAMTVATERESGFAAMLRAQGVPPAALAVAAWVAVTVSAWASLLVGFGVAALVLAANVPLEDLAAFAAMLAVTLAVAAASAAIGTLIAVVVGSRLQAALVAIAAWFVLAVGLDLVVVGLAVFLRLGEPALIGAILLDPFEAGRVLAFLLLDAGGSILGPVGTYLLDRVGWAGAAALLAASLALWIGVPLAAGARLLGRRDL